MTGIPTATVADLNDEYIEKMEDVLEVYERPYDATEPVVCLDEKSVTLHADVRPLVPPCRAERLAGIANTNGAARPTFFAPSNPRQAGTSPLPRLTGPRLNSRASCAISRWNTRKPRRFIWSWITLTPTPQIADSVFGEDIGSEIWSRFTVHYTPKHGSWLNQAEIEISLYARQCLGGRRIPALTTLRRETHSWNRRMNRARKKINWKFDRKAARLKFGYK